MSTRWRTLGPRGIEIVHTNAWAVRGFGLVLLLAGLAMLTLAIGGQLRAAGGPTLSAGFLGMLLFALGFVAVGAWVFGYRGVRRLDAAANAYDESGSIFGLARSHRRPLADFNRVIRVRKAPVDADGRRDSYDLYLYASPQDWTVLITTHDIVQAHELGRAVGELLERPMEELSETQWDKLSA